MATPHLTELQNILAANYAKTPRQLIGFTRKSGHSNTTRTKSYNNSTPLIDLSFLNQVLLVDPLKKVAQVHPNVTMEQLVDETAKYGLMPKVVPEFKGITVGGAIMGWGLESSSFNYGSFNDCCCSFEIMKGNGEIITCSASENSSIFYGIIGSYGSLGIVIKIEIALITKKNFVELTYHKVSSPLEAISSLSELCHSKNPPDFLEGIIFSRNCSVVIKGSLKDTSTSPLFTCSKRSSPWYYQHIKHALEAGLTAETMKVTEYFFRYDKGAFWMGSYICRPQLFFKFLTSFAKKFYISPNQGFSSKEIEKYRNIHDPHILQRIIYSPFMNSQNLFSYLHKADVWIQNRLMIQDFCIPESRSVAFINSALKKTDIFPIWLCPVKTTSKRQLFAPHNLPEDYCINIGVYGMPTPGCSVPQHTAFLEREASELQGRKLLYARSYYDKDSFWKIYSKDEYEELRKTLCSEGIFHDITEKVLSA